MTPAVLVLDEVDTLTNDRLLLDLRALIQHSSPNLSVVVATRVGLRDLLLDGGTTHFVAEDLPFPPRRRACCSNASPVGFSPTGR